jgi:Domain of unknown function (DUF397)
MDWRKSTYSSNGGADCVETASGGGVILVRDSTDRDGRALAIPAAAWTAFTASLR